jgi:hypothetical protein
LLLPIGMIHTPRSPWTLLLLALAGTAACRAAQSSPPSTARATARERPAVLRSGAPLLLAPDEPVAVADSAVRLRFAGVVEDSRCPREVTCVWAGRAVVEIEATVGEDGPQRTVRLEVGAGEASRADLFGVLVAAEELAPYPSASAATQRDAYRLRLALLPPAGG